MRRTAIRPAIALFALTLLAAPLHAAIILETAAAGPSPTPVAGVGGAQWIGARFHIAQAVEVESISVNLSGVSTIFGAIVPLSGPGGLPGLPPSQIGSYALAGTSFAVGLGVADYSTALPVLLAPGDYGVVFGVGAFGAGGAANLTGGNIPTAQASFFSALPLNGDIWLDRPDLTDLRIVVNGQVVPEPATISLLGMGALCILAAGRGPRSVRALVSRRDRVGAS